MNAAASSAQSISDGHVRDTFYAKMISLAALTPEGRPLDLRRDEAKLLLSARTMVSAIRDSEGVSGILLFCGRTLTLANCPADYQELAQNLLKLKGPVLAVPQENAAIFDANIVTPENIRDPLLRSLAQNVTALARDICKRDNFKSIIQSVALRTEELKGTVVTAHAPTRESLRGVTEDLVQTTFYQLMLDHTTQYRFVPQEKLKDRESWVFYVLSAHTLIEAIVQSQQLENAIRLQNGKALTTANCPEKYQELAVHIFKLKLLFPYLTQAQIDYVKYSTIDPEAEIAIPAEIARVKRDDLDRIANAINTVSLTVSQFPSFNQMIVTVLDICDGK